MLRLAALLFVVLAASAQAASTVSVPKALGSRVDKARKVSRIAVLLPDRVDRPGRLHPGGEWRRGHYVLELARARNCHQATACAYAGFMGDRGAKTFGGDKVGLAGGRTGYFTASSCGASCAPPQIQWRQRRVLYTITVKLASGEAQAALVSLANAAIRAGDRG